MLAVGHAALPEHPAERPTGTNPAREHGRRPMDAFESQVLQPAFLSREKTPENQRALLGHFYREHSPEPS
jgi:hypothetical protein